MANSREEMEYEDRMALQSLGNDVKILIAFALGVLVGFIGTAMMIQDTYGLNVFKLFV